MQNSLPFIQEIQAHHRRFANVSGIVNENFYTLKASAASSIIRCSNLSSDESKTIRSLVNGSSIVIKKADKDSAVVVWHRVYFNKEAQKQLKDENVYK